MATIPHINDLKGPPQDVDVHQPIKSLLESADAALRQAEMSREFQKPAIALKSYIRAYTIAIDVVNRHKDYPLLRSDKGGLGKLHASLLKRISQNENAYEQIKRDIIKDNQRTGVRPSSETENQDAPNGMANRKGAEAVGSTPPRSNGHVSSHSINSSGRVRPPVNPKPQSLQGSSIPKHNRASSVNKVDSDLAARFANLRGPQACPGQDPRIKTHPIPQPKPAGPREMPTPVRPTIDTQSSVPTLPKMPDAIYTPTRTNSSADVNRPPVSTPRTSYSRSGSVVSVSSVTGTSHGDYFSSSGTSVAPANNTTGSRAASIHEVSKPTRAFDSDTISAEDLYETLKSGSVLILDIRSREEFDDGHIMSSSIVCIEPNILLRQDITADDIAESMVLSPIDEQNRYENRDKYDVVVFHDENSDSIPRTAQNAEDEAIISIQRALLYLSYGKPLKSAPKLLKGGLDAWIDLVGPAALQTSKTSGQPKPQQSMRIVKKNNFQRRRSENLARYLRPGELKSWQEKIEDDHLKASQSPTLHRSMESFLRRYPAIDPEQESMSSTLTVQKRPSYGVSHKYDLTSQLPSPPTRPAPALPRSSYSSISQATDDSHTYEESAAASVQTPARSGRGSETTTVVEDVRYHTGLINPHNWCYANSTLQSLLASPGFGRELSQPTWKEDYKAPRKPEERVDNPQLMIQIMSTLFHWMSTGKMQRMDVTSLMVRLAKITRYYVILTSASGLLEKSMQSCKFPY